MNFDDKAKEWDKDPEKLKRARIFAAEIALHLNNEKYNTALEFGSGTGLVSFGLTEKFESITLADSSRGMLEVLENKIAAEKIQTMKPFLVSPSNGLNQLAPFDVIYTLLTLHHIKDVPGLFSEFSQILNPGGSLFVGDLFTEDGSFHSSDPEFDGHRGFDPEDLTGMLKSAGFENFNYRELLSITRENGGLSRAYPLFFMSAQKI